jgi:uncharacterized membrane protein
MSTAPPPNEPAARSEAIDALRGLAIVAMFAANLAGPCLRAPHPMWLRIYGSFAAPTFVFLAGFMTTLARRPTPLPRLLKRAALLWLLAAGIDVACWGITPFETFDVLYLLGLALPAAALCGRLNAGLHALIAVGILIATPWLQHALGYGPLLPDHLAYPWPAWRRLLVDGWFPVCPWLGVALLGSLAGRLDLLGGHARRWLVPAGASLAVAGSVAWLLKPPELVTRAGYSELFYPPSPQYLALALGAVLLVLALCKRLERRLPLAGLTVLGRASLVLYVWHVALIALVLDEWFEGQPLPAFLLLYAALSLSAWTVAWLWQRYRSRLAPAGRLDDGAHAARTPGC